MLCHSQVDLGRASQNCKPVFVFRDKHAVLIALAVECGQHRDGVNNLYSQAGMPAFRLVAVRRTSSLNFVGPGNRLRFNEPEELHVIGHGKGDLLERAVAGQHRVGDPSAGGQIGRALNLISLIV